MHSFEKGDLVLFLGSAARKLRDEGMVVTGVIHACADEWVIVELDRPEQEGAGGGLQRLVSTEWQPTEPQLALTASGRNLRRVRANQRRADKDERQLAGARAMLKLARR